MDTLSLIDAHFAGQDYNGFEQTGQTDDPTGGGDPGTGGWWDFVPWDTIGNNLNGLFAWLQGNNGNYGAPIVQPTKDYTMVILAVGGGFILMMFVMLLMLKSTK